MPVPSLENGSPVSSRIGSLARTSSVTSSPVTAATFMASPRSRASRAIIAAQASGAAPPPLVTNFVPCLRAGRQQDLQPVGELVPVTAAAGAFCRMQQRERAFRQRLDHQNVDVAFLDQLQRRIEPIVEERRAAAKPDPVGLPQAHALPRCLSSRCTRCGGRRHYRRAIRRNRMKYRIAGLRAAALSCDGSIKQNNSGGTHETLAIRAARRGRFRGRSRSRGGAAAGNPHLAHHHDGLSAADGGRAREAARKARRAGRHPEPESLGSHLHRPERAVRRAVLRQCRCRGGRIDRADHAVGAHQGDGERGERHLGAQQHADRAEHAKPEREIDPRFHRQGPHRGAVGQRLVPGDAAADGVRQGMGHRELQEARSPHRRARPDGCGRRDGAAEPRGEFGFRDAAVPLHRARDGGRAGRSSP